MDDSQSAVHASLTDHVPWFLPGADGSDPLMTLAALSLLGAVALLGVMFFTLHSLPERLGHKKLQFEIVAVLGLLSLFTHVHLFWVAGLLLALIDLPDFATPLGRISRALEKIAGIEAPREPKLAFETAESPPSPETAKAESEATDKAGKETA
ncbi:MAG: hypothetical protein AB7S74_11305 [Hyphomicrobium sp.]